MDFILVLLIFMIILLIFVGITIYIINIDFMEEYKKDINIKIKNYHEQLFKINNEVIALLNYLNIEKVEINKITFKKGKKKCQ